MRPSWSSARVTAVLCLLLTAPALAGPAMAVVFPIPSAPPVDTIEVPHGVGVGLPMRVERPESGFVDFFGAAVAVDGDVLAVAAPGHSFFRPHGGYVEVHARDGPDAAWERTTRLRAPDEVRGAQFGASLALEGARLVVGEPGANAVHVFERDAASGDWAHAARLTAPEALPGGSFGTGLAVHGDRIVVGAPGVSAGALRSGAVHTFLRDAATGTWTHESTLAPPVPVPDARFGASVAVDDFLLAVGAPGTGTRLAGNVGFGEVVVFRHTTSPTPRWVDEVRIPGPDAPATGAFGQAVALDDLRLLVGAPSTPVEVQGSSQGAAYLFERDDFFGQWTRVALLVGTTPGGGAEPDRFGASVALRGDVAAVGAPLDSPTLLSPSCVSGSAPLPCFLKLSEVHTGAVFLFGPRLDGDWVQTAEVEALDGTDDDILGWSVALGDGDLAAGAPGDDVLRGAAYTMRLGVGL